MNNALLLMQKFLSALPKLESGWVWLAGSGPGDPGLVTAQLLVGMQTADIIVHDALVSQEILALAPAGVQHHYAGKRGGKPSTKQHDICETIIAYAQAGKKVLRLKGGDPMLFGRGAEEAEALVAAKVPFRIIPGVTAGLAASTYAGIPLTHREYSSSVSFITGHAASGDVPNFAWQAMARGTDTLVFYMAMKHIAIIEQQLLAVGLPKDHPVAIISQGTLAQQQVVSGTLGQLSRLAEMLSPPSIVVVGKVVALREVLSWWEQPADQTPLGHMFG